MKAINIIPENLFFMDFDDEEVQSSVLRALAEAINGNREAEEESAEE